MPIKTFDAQCVFIGSQIQHSEGLEQTVKMAEKMPKRERDLYKNYKDLEERPATIALDEKKCLDHFSQAFKFYSSYFFHKSLLSSSEAILMKLKEIFSADTEATLIVYSGNAVQKTGDWLLEFLNEHGEVFHESVSFEEIQELWQARHKSQKHLLLIIDANFSGHWLRRLSLSGETSISVQTSCRYWQRSAEDPKVGSFFLHNLFKLIKKKRSQEIVEPQINAQTPGFYGNFHYAYKYFGLKLKLESWQDLRQALGVSPFGNWPRTTARIEGAVNQSGKELALISPYSSYGLQYGSNVSRNYGSGLQFGGNIHGTKGHANYCSHSKQLAKELFKKGVCDSSRDALLFSSTKIQLPANKKQIQNEKDVDTDIKHFVDKNNRRYEGNVDFKGNKQGFGVLYTEKLTVEYEGQFKDDQKSGKGVEYNTDAFKVYEGEFLEDKKNGVGKIFDEEGNVIFHGEFKDDLKHGEGKEYFPDGKLRFHGCYKSGLRHGKGVEFHNSGAKKYDSTWHNGVMNGTTIECDAKGTVRYKGEYSGGQKSGVGKVYLADGTLEYEGELFEGAFHGKGTLYNENGGKQAEGFFRKGQFEGKEPGFSDKKHSEQRSFGVNLQNEKGFPIENVDAMLSENKMLSARDFPDFFGKQLSENESFRNLAEAEKKNTGFVPSSQEAIELPEKMTIGMANKIAKTSIRENSPISQRNAIPSKRDFSASMRLNQTSQKSITPSELNFKKPATEIVTVVKTENPEEQNEGMIEPNKLTVSPAEGEAFNPILEISKPTTEFLNNGVVVSRKSMTIDHFYNAVISTSNPNYVVEEKRNSVFSGTKENESSRGASRRNSLDRRRKSQEISKLIQEAKRGSLGKTSHEQAIIPEEPPRFLKAQPQPTLAQEQDAFDEFGRPSNTGQRDSIDIHLDSNQLNALALQNETRRQTGTKLEEGLNKGQKIKDFMAKKKQSVPNKFEGGNSLNMFNQINAKKQSVAQTPKEGGETNPNAIRKPSYKVQVVISNNL